MEFSWLPSQKSAKPAIFMVTVLCIILGAACSRSQKPEEKVAAIPDTVQAVDPSSLQVSPETSGQQTPSQEPAAVSPAPVIKAAPFTKKTERTDFEAKLLAGLTVSTETDARAIEDWAAALSSSNELDAAIARLESTIKAASPPAVYFALSVLYGRKGLVTKQYQTLEKAETSAKAQPQVAFNLAVLYGRKETLKSKGTLEDFVPGSIEAASEPAGATVYVDGQAQGITPLTVKGLKAGKKLVRFELVDHDPTEFFITVKAGITETIRADLTAMQFGPSSILVETSPAGAPVFLDDGEEQISPAVFDSVAPGPHSIKIGNSGSDGRYRFEADGRYYLGMGDTSITAKRGERVTFRKEFGLAPGFLKVSNCPVGSTLTINGSPVKTMTSRNSPYYDGEFPTGPVSIKVEFVNFEPWIYETKIEPGMLVAMLPILVPKITVLTRKTIVIDGKIDDWSGIPAIFTDDTGDSLEKKASGSDIVAGYVCRDDTYIYWRMDFANGKPPFASGDKYDLRLGDYETGFDLEAEDRIAHIWDQKKAAAVKVGTIATGASYIEARYPISAIEAGLNDKRTITARMVFWRYKAGSPNTTFDTTYLLNLVIGN